MRVWTLKYERGNFMKISAKITRLADKPDSSVKAFASVNIDGCFAVHGLRVIETDKGRFVNMPSNSYKDKAGKTQYSDIFHPVTKGAREALTAAVLNAYEIRLEQERQTEIEVQEIPDDEPDLDDTGQEFSM